MDKPAVADSSGRAPRKQGSSAQFTWQTILVLRLAIILKHKFRLELQAHRALFVGLRRSLKGRSFLELWDRALLLRAPTDWDLVDTTHDAPQGDAVIVRLNPHLEVLAVGFSLPRPETIGQLDLFPATVIGTTPRERPTIETIVGASSPIRRRRSG